MNDGQRPRATARAPATQGELPLTTLPGGPPRRGSERRRDTRASRGRWALDCNEVERARVIANLTYQQLAAAAHVDRATLSDMLNGRRSPTLGSVHAVIRALGLEAASVLLFK